MICKGVSLPFLFSISICFISIPALYSNIVMNEVCYDPIGSDDFHEWIEFYNNGTADVDMEDWTLYSGGADWSLIYTFPHFVLRPQHYLLLAEEDCPDAHLFANITLQNGGSQTDGICLASPDGLYTDTVLYDSPNINQLSDDLNDIGTEFCPDVAEGHSLARIHDGVDTNKAADWFDCALPTPNSANIIPVNLSLALPIITIQGYEVKINTSIHNLSTTDVYNSHESLEVKLDNVFYSFLTIPNIDMQDSVSICIPVHCTENGSHQISLFLNVIHDVNPVDNLWITSVFLGEIPIIFNELLYSPSPDNQEWIEIYNRGNADLSLHNMHLRDASHNELLFDLDIPAKTYQVLCVDSIEFVHNYPGCPAECIKILDHWVTLNNDEETIWLLDDANKTLDSLHYVGSSQAYNKSLERRNTTSSPSAWDICSLPAGGTPGQVNSNFMNGSDVFVNYVQIVAQGDSLIHRIHLQCDEPENELLLACRQFGDSDEIGEELFQQYISLPQDSVFVFSMPMPGNGYYAFQYNITVPPTSAGKVPLPLGGNVPLTSGGSSSSEYWSFYNANSLPFVVNEIMYDPVTGYPEWLEIRRNCVLPKYPLLTIYISSDSVAWQADDNQFYVLVHDEQDAESLGELFQFTPDKFVYGLSSLLNSGEAVFLSDSFGNVWDAFSYDPQWSPDKGISMERVQPLFLPGSDNWSPSLAESGGTPGQENSVFVNHIPANTNIDIHPNPFFPKKEEICEIQFSFPRAISRVSCKIYDLKGRLVRTLSDQSLESAEGSFLWDGRNDTSTVLPVGVYLVYFEAYDKNQGNKFHLQKTVVLGN